MWYAVMIGMSLFCLMLAVNPSASKLERLFARQIGSWKDMLEQILKAGEWFFDLVLGRIRYFHQHQLDMEDLLEKNGYPKGLSKGITGLQWGLAIFMLAISMLTASPLLILVSVFVLFAVPYFLKQRWKKRRAEMSKHVLSLAELTAVGVSAGLSPLESLQQAINGRQGELFDELQLAISRVRLGVPAQEAFMECSQKVELQEMYAFLDQLIQAIETGASGFAESVVELVRHLRELRQSKIEEIAGKAESKLLLPLLMFFGAIVAFLLGPLTFAFLEVF